MSSTIVAIATPQGKGGVGIIRVSGPNALNVGLGVTRLSLNADIKARQVYFKSFYDSNAQVLDQGLFIYFKAPHSFTGEDVVELQAHGGPMVLDLLLKACLQTGAEMARAGEFSERAFLNDKIDLLQAEAIADLIDAGSEQAARCAMRSLSGGFSQKVQSFFDQLVRTRVELEACLDFPEEEVADVTTTKIKPDLIKLTETCNSVIAATQQGVSIRNGINVAILGAPNVGKSSLMNLLCETQSAIVTEIAGTTRDVLKESILIDGILVNLLDTAGLRDTQDVVEKEGIRRAKVQAQTADLILYLVDARVFKVNQIPALKQAWSEFGREGEEPPAILLLVNKIDLCDESPLQIQVVDGVNLLYISVQQNLGITKLKEKVKSSFGFDTGAQFTARRRHLHALEKTQTHLNQAITSLESANLELSAEDLRLAQRDLGELTGTFSSDDLLGEIFATFCMGK